MGRKRSKQKRKQKKKDNIEDPAVVNAPHTFVFARGKIGDKCKQLTLNMRRVMEPYTATKLQPKRMNVMKDFVAIAGPLRVSHFLTFTKSPNDVLLRLMRIPRGPTLYFKVLNYSLMKDVESSIKKPKTFLSQYVQSPLLILNGFQKVANSDMSNESENPFKLCSTMLQNMFPSLNIHKVSLNGVKRCVLFNCDPESGRIEFRHYNITVKPVGVSRRVKKLVFRQAVPNLSKLNDISDYLLAAGEGSASESELEADDPNNRVELAQSIKSHGNVKNGISAVRLTELGPRMTLELYKIEDGFCDGEVLYHRYIKKTEEEKQALRNQIRKRHKLKNKRKRIQEENVKRKKQKKELAKQQSLQTANQPPKKKSQT